MKGRERDILGEKERGRESDIKSKRGRDRQSSERGSTSNTFGGTQEIKWRRAREPRGERR